MQTAIRDTDVTAFMAECFWPGITLRKVAAVGARAHAVCEEVSSAGVGCRHLGSILVPADEIALFLLEATSLDAAIALAEQAAIPAERILEIVRLTAFVPPGICTTTARQRSFDEPSP
jgi:hypothetical protein